MSSTVSSPLNSEPTHSAPNETTGSSPKTIAKINIQLIGWLMLVQYHSQSASPESLESLQHLAIAVPSQTENLPEVIQVFEAIHRFAPSKIYNPDLYETASSALSAVRAQLPHPIQLNFPNH